VKKPEDIMCALECCSHKKDSDECDNCLYFSGCAVSESGAFTELAHDALALIRKYDDALRLMVYQYCTVEKGTFENGWPENEVFFNKYMSAGENAFKVLGIENEQEVPEDWV
jgi:hypothetical protein